MLTKLDKLRQGQEAGRAAAYLANQRKPLRLGYHGLVNTSLQEEENLRRSPDFERVRDRIGIRPLRQHLIRILATRIQAALPKLQRAAVARMETITNELRSLGAMDEEEDDAERTVTWHVLRLTVPLVKNVERSARTNLVGYTTAVSTTEASLGCRIWRHIMSGAVAASAAGRGNYSLATFKSMLDTARKNMHGAADSIMPVELTLTVGVSILVKGFR